MLRKTDRTERAALFRERLATALRQSGMSQAGLARAVGVDRSTVTQALGGVGARMPGAYFVAASAQALGVSGDWLLGLSDRPEQVGQILAASLKMTPAARTATDAQILEWHQEAAGYKIRHVPANLPDMLKTHEVLAWEYGTTPNRSPEQAIEAAEARLDYMRSSQSDFEIALPLHELRSFALGQGYYEGLEIAHRRAQIDWFITVHEQLYPGLRLVVFDTHKVFSAPLTIFGPKLAVLYLGQHYLAFRDRDRVRAMTDHFDWLVREAIASSRDIPGILRDLRSQIA